MDCDGVGLRPDGLAVLELDAIHGERYAGGIHDDVEIVVVDAVIGIGIAGSAIDGVSVRAASAGHEIGDAAVFVALVVMHVAGDDDESGSRTRLSCFEKCAERLLGWPGVVAAAQGTMIVRTRDWRMVENEEHEINAGGNLVELLAEPIMLRP